MSEATAADNQVAQLAEQTVVNVRCSSSRFHHVSPQNSLSCPKTHEESLITRWFYLKTVKSLTFAV